MIKNRSNETANETDSTGNENESGQILTKQNNFLQAFGNIFNEMKGNSILLHAPLQMQQKQDKINIEFVSDKYALDDIIDDAQGQSLQGSHTTN